MNHSITSSTSPSDPRVTLDRPALLGRTEAAGLAGRPAPFQSILAPSRVERTPEQKARDAAESFVAQALVLPVLKQLRESNRAATPFAPGPYERSIGSLFDAETAARIVRAERFPLVERVAQNLLKHQAAASGTFPAPDHAGATTHEHNPRPSQPPGGSAPRVDVVG